MYKSKIFTMFCYIYGFMIFYLPNLENLTGFRTQYIMIGLLIILLPPLILYSKKEEFLLKNEILFLISGIFLSALYFSIRALFGYESLRILQNIYIISQILHVVIFISIIRRKVSNFESVMKVLLNLALFQSLIILSMVFFPELKQISLHLYYNNREENIFISANRIYGISSDYTYFTPVYHGILGCIAIIIAVVKNGRYILYLPFLILNIVVNGRIGIIVMFAGIIIGLIYLVITKGYIKKVIVFSTVILISISILLLILRYLVPNTYSWIMSGINDTSLFILYGELSGNYKALFSDMIIWPHNILFGEGHRVYGSEGLRTEFGSSDIGYINDLFMGGLIYVFILYGAIFFFVLKRIKTSDQKLNLMDRIISISCFIMLVIANYKGESMRSGIILLVIIFIKLALISFEEKQVVNDG